jgi:hypothetical protein
VSGTKIGAAKMLQTIKAKYGEDFYKRIGAIGGSKSRPETRPFSLNKNLASTAGSKGGGISKRLKAK